MYTNIGVILHDEPIPLSRRQFDIRVLLWDLFYQLVRPFWQSFKVKTSSQFIYFRSQVY